MNQAEVIAKLQTIFDTVFLEPVVLTPAISAKDVPEWDSLTHISLMVSVEKAFGVRFRVGEVTRLGRVAREVARGDVASLAEDEDVIARTIEVDGETLVFAAKGDRVRRMTDAAVAIARIVATTTLAYV